MNANSHENANPQGGSLFRFAHLDLKKDLRRYDSIEVKLFKLILDELQRYNALPKTFVEYAGKTTTKPISKEIEDFYLESLRKLEELGNNYKSQIEEEKILCKKLKEFSCRKQEIKINIDKENKQIVLKMKLPIELFIKANYKNIIEIRKKNTKNIPLKENVYLENKKQRATKYKTIENFVCVDKLSIPHLQEMSNLFKDATLKYPRLIHVVLEWPLFSPMPKPPRELLTYCESAEYEYMLKRCKNQLIHDSDFSTPETQSTKWLVNPKGESWCKESGFKLYHESWFDLNKALNCNWEVLLHIFGLTMSYGNNHHILYDGWDGLFDEDYHFDDKGWRKGLYNSYYITDVFYESMRLCKSLIELTKKQKMNISIPDDLTDTEKNLLQTLGTETLKGKLLIEKAGYDYEGTYRGILSNLKKRGILGHNQNGYFRIKN